MTYLSQEQTSCEYSCEQKYLKFRDILSALPSQGAIQQEIFDLISVYYKLEICLVAIEHKYEKIKSEQDKYLKNQSEQEQSQKNQSEQEQSQKNQSEQDKYLKNQSEQDKYQKNQSEQDKYQKNQSEQDKYLKSQSEDFEMQIKQLKKHREILDATIYSLYKNKSYLVNARTLKRETEFFLRKLNNPIWGRLVNLFKKFLYASSTSNKVILGLFCAFPIYILIVYLPYKELVFDPFIKNLTVDSKVSTSEPGVTSKKISEYDVDKTIALLVLAGIAGSLGSSISILSRIKEDYHNEKYTDSLVPVMIGACKPLIGGSFGILLFTMIGSGLLPLKIDDADEPMKEFYTLFAIAFIGGFSERLVKDIISQTEEKILAPRKSTITLNRTQRRVVSYSTDKSGSQASGTQQTTVTDTDQREEISQATDENS